jgi:NitT/TauT family transport system ATP-binding protein
MGAMPSAASVSVATAQPVLQVQNVMLQYRAKGSVVTATYDVSFDVYAGDRFVLLGPSGCGKSSLLKAVGGFIAPVQGEILLEGVPVRRPGPDRMMVFQEFDQLLPWKTVQANIAYPMQVNRRFSKDDIKARAACWLERAHLAKFGNAYPHMLSGGMKQRAAIARAMAMEPKMLLMDEPFAALDALTRRSMQNELLDLWSQTKLTTLFVTHSIEEAILVGSRILVLSPHPGRVRAEINVDHLGFDDLASPAVSRIHDQIHSLLFDHEAAANV